jgi:hypothetical protein
VSTLSISSGAATPVRVVNLSMTQGFHRWPIAGGRVSPLYQMSPECANPGAQRFAWHA